MSACFFRRKRRCQLFRELSVTSVLYNQRRSSYKSSSKNIPENVRFRSTQLLQLQPCVWLLRIQIKIQSPGLHRCYKLFSFQTEKSQCTQTYYKFTEKLTPIIAYLLTYVLATEESRQRPFDAVWSRLPTPDSTISNN